MNNHEIERIAAAMHQLRPDWHAASIKTLIAKHLADRPRRDVTVALAWVACESNSHTPARVLEAGPWWQAVAVDAITQPGAGRPPRADESCRLCGRFLSACVCGEKVIRATRPADPERVHAIVQRFHDSRIEQGEAHE